MTMKLKAASRLTKTCWAFISGFGEVCYLLFHIAELMPVSDKGMSEDIYNT